MTKQFFKKCLILTKIKLRLKWWNLSVQSLGFQTIQTDFDYFNRKYSLLEWLKQVVESEKLDNRRGSSRGHATASVLEIVAAGHALPL